jgi:HTH-type transcriptional regulator/antitoxin HigA
MEGIMAVAEKQLVQAWGTLQQLAPIAAIHTEEQYDRAAGLLEDLLDIVEDDEDHPLYELMDTLSILIHDYDEHHYQIPDATEGEVLQFLMEAHDLTPADLSELGEELVVLELLSGKRPFEVDHIRALSKRFHVSPATFF